MGASVLKQAFPVDMPDVGSTAELDYCMHRNVTLSPTVNKHVSELISTY